MGLFGVIKILTKKMRAVRPEFFWFKVFTHKTVPEPVLYMCVLSAQKAATKGKENPFNKPTPPSGVGRRARHPAP